MPWFFYSILTSLSFVGMILYIKKLTNLGFSSRQILFFLYIFTLSGFVAINIIFFGDVWQSDKLPSFLSVMLIAGFFAFLGNWADFEAIKRAPNAGYPVAVRNATILPVTILSVLAFGSTFNWFKLFGIFAILIGIILLTIGKKKHLGNLVKSSSWQLPALLALFSFTIMILAQKQATLIPNVSTIEINLSMSLINFLGFSFLCRKDLKNYFSDKTKLRAFLPLVFLAAVFSFLANFLSIKGLALASNPGYHEAIKNTNILFITLLSIKIFSVRLEKLKILGVLAIVFGMINLFI